MSSTVQSPERPGDGARPRTSSCRRRRSTDRLAHRPESAHSDHVAPLVRPLHCRTRCRRVRARQVAARRSPPDRRRHHRQRSVGRSAGPGRRPLARPTCRPSSRASTPSARPSRQPGAARPGRSTKTFIRLSSASSSSASAMRAAACTRADRATSRSRWISGSTCRRRIPALSARHRGARRRDRRVRPRPPARPSCRRTRTCDARSPCSSRTCGSRTRRRFAATSIGFEAARREADVMPLGSGAIAGTAYAIDVAFLAERLGFSRVAANSIDVVGRPRLRRDVPLRVRDDDGAPQPAGRGRDPLLERGVRVLRDLTTPWRPDRA